MLRRNARLRREYLYRKSLQGKEKESVDKKQSLQEALDANSALPTELKDEHHDLLKEMKLDGDIARLRPSIDDEYARAGLEDPKIFLTTSRDPSSKLQQFVKELRFVFPNAQRINRGNHITSQLVAACRANNVTDIVIVHEHRGEPDGLIVSHMPYGPTAYFGLSNVVTRHDIQERAPISLAFPHLIFHNFSTPLGLRVQTILKHLFPVPKDDAKRVLTFANQGDYISFRHHVYSASAAHHREVDLKEVGPRFEMKLYQIRLGTLEQEEADLEWTLRPYMNTAWKRQALGADDSISESVALAAESPDGDAAAASSSSSTSTTTTATTTTSSSSSSRRPSSDASGVGKKRSRS